MRKEAKEEEMEIMKKIFKIQVQEAKERRQREELNRKYSD